MSAIAALAASLAACGGIEAAPPPSPHDIQATLAKGALPLDDPASPAWRGAPEHTAALMLQEQTEPNLMKPGIESVKVRALTDGKWIVFRLEWADGTRDTLSASGRYGDAVAVQLPTEAGGNVPDAAMGEEGKQVRITQWRASWQETGDPVAALYPNARPDHYPFESAAAAARPAMEELYAPARGAKNPVTIRSGDSPTQDLIAEGFGTLTADEKQLSRGRGVYQDGAWKVTIARPLDGDEKGALRPGARTYAAFAVWDGSSGNVGSRKMISGWVPLALAAAS